MKETRFKQTEIGLVPEEWEVVRLGEVCNNSVGLTYSPDNVSQFGTLVLRSSNIQDNQLVYDNNVFVNMVVPSRAIVHEGDILICVRNGSKSLIGKSAIIDNNAEGMAFGAFMTVLRSTQVNKFYLNAIWQSAIIQEQVQNNLGATINQITNKDISGYIIPLPPLAEQSRIAGALSSVDGLLSSLSRLIEKKRALRTATMQQLLTAKTRLPGFDEPWKEVRMGEAGLNIQKGGVLQSKNFVSGNIKVIAGGKAEAGFHNVANYYGETITISASGANAGYVWLHKEPIYATDCSVITPSEFYDLSFVYYVLSSKQSDIYKLQTGGAQPHVHPNAIKEILCFLPSLPEQRAIAAVLSSMDAEITALEAKRAKVEALRTGMMQELLTGRIRLTGE